MTELYKGKPCKRGHDGTRYITTKGCVECQKILRAKHDEANREKRLSQRTAWQRANPEAIAAWKKKNADHLKESRRKWARENRGLVNANNAKRRAARKNATPPWLTAEQLNEMKLFYINCPEGYEVDHIHPLQGKNSCGLHVPWNLQYLTIEANRKKGNR